jgi:hypothetical protein
MTIPFYEGFDDLASDTEFQQTGNLIVHTSCLISTTVSRTGTRSMNMGTVAAKWRFGVPTARNEFIVGFGFRWTNGTSTNTKLLEFFSSANSAGQVWLHFNSSAQFAIGRGSAGEGIDGTSPNSGPTTVLWQDTTVQPSDTWMFLEMHVFVHDTAGTITFKKNEIVLFTATGLDTKNGSSDLIDWIRFCAPFTNVQPTWHIDDVYIVDPAVAPYTTFLGESQVNWRAPTGDSGAQQWTPSTGVNHWANVDEVPNDVDGTYNSAPTAALTNLHTYAALPSNIGAIRALKVRTRFRKDDAGGCTVRNKVVSSGGGAPATTFNGAAYNPGVSYGWQQDTMEVDPDTAAAWLKASADAIISGYERTS